MFLLGGRQPAEAWLVCHGYGQLAERFLRAFETVATPERLVVAPEAPSRFYLEQGQGRVGATWMTREDRDQEIVDQLGHLDALLTDLFPAGDLPALTFLGFSQGAATAARWAAHVAQRAPSRRLILWGGGLPPEVPPEAPGLNGVRLDLVIGDQDTLVPAAAVDQLASALERAGRTVRRYTFAGGHVMDSDLLATLAGS